MSFECPKCKRELPDSAYYFRKGKREGERVTPCKECYRAINQDRKDDKRKWSRTEKGKSALRKHRSGEQYAETKREWQREYRQRDDVKVKRSARARIRYRIKTGKLPHPSELPCALCGRSASEYHHYNGYERDDVQPVCSECHRTLHEQFKRID